VLCPQCQAASEQDSAFCASCGARLDPSSAPQPAYQQSAYQQPAAAQHGEPAGGYGYTPAGGDYQPANNQYQPSGPARTAAPYQFDQRRLTGPDLIVGIATLIAMISIFLTWFTVTISASFAGQSQSQTLATASGTGGHGWLWLVFILGLAIIAYLVMSAGWAEPPVKLPIAHGRLLLLGAGIQFLLVLIAFLVKPAAPSTSGVLSGSSISSILSSLGLNTSGNGISISVGWGIGAYLGLIAALVAAAAAVPAIQSKMATVRR
jgi:hypothetical protein